MAATGMRYKHIQAFCLGLQVKNSGCHLALGHVMVFGVAAARVRHVLVQVFSLGLQIKDGSCHLVFGHVMVFGVPGFRPPAAPDMGRATRIARIHGDWDWEIFLVYIYDFKN